MATLVSCLAMAAWLMVVCGLLTAGNFFSSYRSYCCSYCCSCFLSPCFSSSTVLFPFFHFSFVCLLFSFFWDFLSFFLAFFQHNMFTDPSPLLLFLLPYFRLLFPLSVIFAFAVLNFLLRFFHLRHAIVGAVFRYRGVSILGIFRGVEDRTIYQKKKKKKKKKRKRAILQ